MLITQCKLQIDNPREGSFYDYTVQWLDKKSAKLGSTAKYNDREWIIVEVWATVDTKDMILIRRI